MRMNENTTFLSIRRISGWMSKVITSKSYSHNLLPLAINGRSASQTIMSHCSFVWNTLGMLCQSSLSLSLSLSLFPVHLFPLMFHVSRNHSISEEKSFLCETWLSWTRNLFLQVWLTIIFSSKRSFERHKIHQTYFSLWSMNNLFCSSFSYSFRRKLHFLVQSFENRCLLLCSSWFCHLNNQMMRTRKKRALCPRMIQVHVVITRVARVTITFGLIC
jgi:hypothetical protein